jgi:hypothetical protein
MTIELHTRDNYFKKSKPTEVKPDSNNPVLVSSPRCLDMGPCFKEIIVVSDDMLCVLETEAVLEGKKFVKGCATTRTYYSTNEINYSQDQLVLNSNIFTGRRSYYGWKSSSSENQ